MAEMIVNHILFYVANKYTTTARDIIVNNVVKFFADFNEINDAKKLLYEKTTKNFTPRRGDDKATKTAQDIVDTFVASDNGGVSLPTFVATNIGRFPVTSDGTVTMEQVMVVVASINHRLGDVEKTLSTKNNSTARESESNLVQQLPGLTAETVEDPPNHDSQWPGIKH